MMENIKDYLTSNNIRPSYPRLKIFEYLDSKKSHPTVDEIYTALYEEIPTLSKTTVYNTLKLFLREGIVKVITIEDGEARYDSDTSVHGHFKCLNCGAVHDFEVDLPDDRIKGLEGFEVEKREFYYFGKCKKCL
jgi:Fur family transcriptional regulator, peroxide stress response regulator